MKVVLVFGGIEMKWVDTPFLHHSRLVSMATTPVAQRYYAEE